MGEFCSLFPHFGLETWQHFNSQGYKLCRKINPRFTLHFDWCEIKISLGVQRNVSIQQKEKENPLREHFSEVIQMHFSSLFPRK